MHWYNYLGWLLIGFFIVFFGVGTVAGIDESQEVIPVLVILVFAVGLVLANKY